MRGPTNLSGQGRWNRLALHAYHPLLAFMLWKISVVWRGKADLTMRICSTHMRIRINKHALTDAHAPPALCNCSTQGNIANTRLWKQSGDIFPISGKMACTLWNIRLSQQFFWSVFHKNSCWVINKLWCTIIDSKGKKRICVDKYRILYSVQLLIAGVFSRHILCKIYESPD